jgi:signal transduction histidine kinase
VRRRIALALAGLAILTLALYAGPRTYLTVTDMRESQEALVERSASLASVDLDNRIDRGEDIDQAALQDLAQPGDRITLSRPDGRLLQAGEEYTAERAVVARRTLADGSTLSVELSDSAASSQFERSLVAAIVIAAFAIVFSVLAALIIAERLVRPFEALGRHASTLTEDEPDPAPRSGMAEADRLADALDQTAGRVQSLLRREREFSVNASHQLRTPLSALRLRLEDLTRWDETGPSVADELKAALEELDRLNDTITDLLEFARRGGIGAWSEVDVVSAVQQSIDHWEPIFSNAERRLVLREPDGPAVAPTSPRGLKLILDVLMENALVHGRGTVKITVLDQREHVLVCVADEGKLDRSGSGQRAFDQLGTRHRSGSGIGLPMAQAIAEAAGARVSVAATDPTAFEIKLPVESAV